MNTPFYLVPGFLNLPSVMQRAALNVPRDKYGIPSPSPIDVLAFWRLAVSSAQADGVSDTTIAVWAHAYAAYCPGLVEREWTEARESFGELETMTGEIDRRAARWRALQDKLDRLAVDA